jgi:hypothetical protein
MRNESLIVFKPARHRRGYQLLAGLASPTRAKDPMRLQTIVRPRDPSPEAKLTHPKMPADLYAHFAQLNSGDDAAILGFANEYGLLGLPETKVSVEQGVSIGGEATDAWHRASATMNSAIERWRLAQTKKPGARKTLKREEREMPARAPARTSDELKQVERDEEMKWKWVEPALALGDLEQELNKWLCSLAMIRTDNDQKLRLRVVPRDLLQALWLQLAQDVSADKIVRQCANSNCKEWIVATPGTRSFRKKSCSDTCRQLLFQKRRHKRRPSRTRADGHTGA